nr:ribonuclease H-like domain, reverse transcriptase, RNA-dependent DNA polymerase [Tanacetum cinerariifolium]
AKTTSWNEFSSTMASAIICLAINQKFNFSKYIFDNMVRNLEGGVKFLMFPRFMQVFLVKQVEGMFKHNEIYVTPSHSKKVVTYEVVYEKMYDRVERASTTATGLDADQDRGIISKTQFMATLNEPSSIGTSSGSGPRRQETMGDVDAQTRSERVSKFSNDPPLSRVNTLRSGEDRLKIFELIKFCTQLQSKVLALKTTKTNQALEIGSLKRRVKKLEKKANKRTHKLKRLYKIGSSRRIESSDEASLGDQEDASKQRRIIDNLDADEGVTLVNETHTYTHTTLVDYIFCAH